MMSPTPWDGKTRWSAGARAVAALVFGACLAVAGCNPESEAAERRALEAAQRAANADHRAAEATKKADQLRAQLDEVRRDAERELETWKREAANRADAAEKARQQAADARRAAEAEQQRSVKAEVAARRELVLLREQVRVLREHLDRVPADSRVRAESESIALRRLMDEAQQREALVRRLVDDNLRTSRERLVKIEEAARKATETGQPAAPPVRPAGLP